MICDAIDALLVDVKTLARSHLQKLDNLQATYPDLPILVTIERGHKLRQQHTNRSQIMGVKACETVKTS